MANQQLTPDVLDVLKRSKIAQNVLCLPNEVLPRPLYEAVNKALVAAGGRWKRGKGHIFESDPREKLGLMIAAGVAVDEKKQYQAFFTPPQLAKQVAEMAEVSGQFVLEPSAGKGALVEACAREGARGFHCVELNPEYADSLRADGLTGVVCGDFLTMTPHRAYSRVVMNPPFTRGADVKHVSHALKWLAPGGILVSVMLANKTDAQLEKLANGNEWTCEEVPAGAFKESGTNVPTIILTIKSPND